MKLSVSEALRKGAEAQSAGKAQEARRYYAAILKLKPNHPSANHSMGALSIGFGKKKEAIAFFKKALDANPSVPEYWFSYIDALIKSDMLVDAKSLIAQAKQKGVWSDRFNLLDRALASSNEKASEPETKSNKLSVDRTKILDKSKLSQALKLAKQKSREGFPEEARLIYQLILSKFPNNKEAIAGNKGIALKLLSKGEKSQDPPRNQLQALNNLYNQGKLEKASTKTANLLAEFPNSFILHNLDGAIKENLNKYDEAIRAFREALAINPNASLVHYNLGNVLKDQDRLEEATNAYMKAVEVNPNFANAYNNMSIAQKKRGKLEKAVEACRKAISIDPNHVGAYLNLGHTLYDQRKLEKAARAYTRALSIKPNYPEAHFGLGNTRRDLGNLEQAKEAYKRALSIKPNYPDASHWLSVLNGETTNSPPREYVENLFDAFATKFDQSLVNDLKYNIPKILTQSLIKEAHKETLGAVLDLGCGTGLMGAEIRKFCSTLEGIDLSNSMLDQAKVRNVYDRLTHIGMDEYLSSEELDFDYFISTDVFVYVGELSEVFSLIKSRNRRSGKLAFSTEHTEKDGFHLEKSGRYSHSKSYIESICKNFGYTICHYSKTKLRKESGVFLEGGLYILDF